MDLTFFKIPKPSKFSSPAQLLAADIYEYFGKELSFPMLMRFIKEKGERAVYFIFNDVKRSDFPHKVPLFLKKIREEKII